ncbi:hypothetical protein Nepgr_023752 [Nepenthes gracilis]|uniref:Uncharacterized protein n=1 Tax=Nepenthes gracilis TaxID=150966 RepID=A0AAD3T3C3_NEPGR|nr:hypothetical protein Nepgr_023752 [Nepenthes gracilis]
MAAARIGVTGIAKSPSNGIFPSNKISVVSHSFSPTFSTNIPLLYLVLLLAPSSRIPCLNSSIDFNRNRHRLVVSVSISEIERERVDGEGLRK